MPYKSKAQAAYFNIHKGELEKQGVNVNEWNSASKGTKMPQYAKGSAPSEASYAKGGTVLGRSEDWAKKDPQGRSEFGKFLGTEDEFRDPGEGNARADEDQKYGKTGDGAGKGTIKPPKAADKSLKAIKPRK